MSDYPLPHGAGVWSTGDRQREREEKNAYNISMGLFFSPAAAVAVATSAVVLFYYTC